MSGAGTCSRRVRIVGQSKWTARGRRSRRAWVLVHVGRGSLDNQHGRLGVGVHVGRGYLFTSGADRWIINMDG